MKKAKYLMALSETGMEEKINQFLLTNKDPKIYNINLAVSMDQYKTHHVLIIYEEA